MLNRRTLLKLSGAAPLWAAAQDRHGPAGDTAALRPAIWDVHCHIANPATATPEDRMAGLVRHMDRLGISRAVLSLGNPILADPTPQQLRDTNDQVMRALARWPERAFGYVYVNPNHVEFSLQEMDRCVRDGPMTGIKLWIARHCNDPALDPLIERAAQLRVPVLQHTWMKAGGNEPGESTPYDILELAVRHPNATLIAAHIGGDWERGIRIVRPAKNIVMDTAGFDPTAGVVEMAVRELGAERIVYGSDAGGRSFASQLGKVMGAEIPETARRLILAGNLRRIMTPILKAKGDRA